ncbi:4-coumarate--CoA ligase 1 [Drosophila mojavensis]|uniref:Uncharacterized protein n=1 Tax=Drosophila mojavensis TaxID=7230 RepID=B4KU87_DROMO|nr:4-coumarate--CoA ligase 1 [Drosophila mojavensis]EDW09683.1 uncharacterized protein Dmoj_GI18904 [Drosophila mojavensis]
MATKAIFPTFYDAETKIWSGLKKRPHYDPDCSAGEVFFCALRNYPNLVIQINDVDGSTVTSGQIRQWGIRLALYLQREQLTQEDVVGIIAHSSKYIDPLILACLLQATPFHAVNATRDTETVTHLFAVTKPKIMFCDAADYERINQVTKAFAPKIITLTGRVPGVPHIEDLLLQPVPGEATYQPATLKRDGNQTAIILCSSGTAGLPKAVAISHYHILQISPFCNSSDTILTHATVDWATGFIAIAISLLYGSSRVLFEGAYNAERFVQLIQKYKVTTLAMAPWQAYELFTHPLATEESLATIKMSFITGGWVALPVLQRAQRLTRGCVMFSYGTTETGAITVNIDHTLDNSVGRVCPGLRIKIVDEEGNSLGHNQVGEILIDIGSKWGGYLCNPEETATTLRDGWFHLGDMGYFDNDNNLYIVDRKKDLLKYKSKHYWPTELEQIIAELPDVQHVCVVGVRDPKNGDSAGALVIKKPGSPLTQQQIIEHVAKRVVVDYKQLNSGVQFVDSLPNNNNGKVLRSLAREQFEALMK